MGNFTPLSSFLPPHTYTHTQTYSLTLSLGGKNAEDPAVPVTTGQAVRAAAAAAARQVEVEVEIPKAVSSTQRKFLLFSSINLFFTKIYVFLLSYR